jgi:YegS/Rv2252/BmrU family lipid kinase
LKIHFIYNPRSGPRRRNSNLLSLLRDFIAGQSDARLLVTDGPGHATDLAREAVAAGCERVVAVGGDGTMNEVAQALVGGPVALALVPCGSGNGLARYLGIPGSPISALKLAGDARARISPIDTGAANGRLFVNLMGLGFDAEISRRFHTLSGRGLSGYVGAGYAAFYGQPNERCVITSGLDRLTVEILLITVANSDQYGHGAIIAPGARVDDGMLDLVAVAPVGLIRGSVLAARMFLGGIRHSSSIKRLRGARFVIERKAPGLIHTDGECHSEGATVEIAVKPGSLRVVVPADAPLSPTKEASYAG